MEEQYLDADINEALFLILLEDAVCCETNITSRVLPSFHSVNMTNWNVTEYVIG